MKQNLQEELNRMKYLLNAERGKVISETEIKNTFISEQEWEKIEQDEDDFVVYLIKPYKKGLPDMEVAVKDNKIYSVIGNKINGYQLDKEIGFPSGEILETELENYYLASVAKRKRKQKKISSGIDQKVKSGIEYAVKVMSAKAPSQLYNIRGEKSFTNFRGYSPNYNAIGNVIGIGFAFEENVPYFYVKDLDKLYRNDVTIKIEEEQIITTTTTQSVVPRDIQLDLQNPFFYDCPGKGGCGTRGGSNTRPFRDESAEQKVIEFGKNINNFYKEKEPIYVLGFASTDGASQHNLELSQNRANFVADLIKKQITNPSIKIIPMGMGETEAFQAGTTEDDYVVNRKILVTKDPDSLEPFVFKFKIK